MPLFEYACRSCARRFEFLTRAGHEPACPTCAGTDLEKLLSVFAVGTATSPRAAFDLPIGACGTCGDPRGPGSCSID